MDSMCQAKNLPPIREEGGRPCGVRGPGHRHRHTLSDVPARPAIESRPCLRSTSDALGHEKSRFMARLLRLSLPGRDARITDER